MRLPHSARRGVDILQMSGLGIFEFHQPHIGQLSHALVVHLHCHHVMTTAGHGQLAVVVVGIKEVGKQKGHAAFANDAHEVFQAHTDVGARPHGAQGEEFADDAQDVCLSFGRWDKLLHTVGEEEHPNFVVVANGGESQGGSNFGEELALRLPLRPEVERTGHIDEQHSRQFAFFLKHLHIGAVETSRHVPIDVAYIVALLILTHLRKGHAAPFEGRVVLACKNVVGEGVRFDFYAPHALHELSDLLVHDG